MVSLRFLGRRALEARLTWLFNGSRDETFQAKFYAAA
jgi:hypothetical protein